MQPDLVWVKDRTGANNHYWVDAQRGTGKALFSNLTNSESTDTNTISAFNSNGFSISGTSPNLNTSTDNYVAWQWKESATPGFDIVTYTGTGVNGQLINHNLGVTPSMIMYKCRDTPTGVSGNWIVWHKSISQSFPTSTTFTATGFTGALLLNSTSGSLTYGYDNQIGESGKNYVAYLWSEVAGFSKFGSYVGNGSADGPFIYLGFKPALFITKKINSTSNWCIEDGKRPSYNLTDEALFASDSRITNAGLSGTFFGNDFLSNGVKIRNTGDDHNASSSFTYIYMAFAENPFKYALAR